MFRSRWKALWWAAGVLFTAYSCVPSQEETLQKQTEQKTEQAQKNPWALDK